MTGGYERDLHELTVAQGIERNARITKFQAAYNRLSEDPGLVERLEAERDRLAAENAELRENVTRWKRIARLEFRKFRAWKNYGEGRRDEVFTATTTLAALRQVVQSNEWCYAKHTDTDGQMERIEDILYPQEIDNEKD